IVNNGQAARLYRNDGGNRHHFLQVMLRGHAPNTCAVGARVYVTAAGTTQMRELRLGNNFASHDPVVAYFGLGTAVALDELRIVWPNGATTLRRGLESNQFLTIDEAP